MGGIPAKKVSTPAPAKASSSVAVGVPAKKASVGGIPAKKVSVGGIPAKKVSTPAPAKASSSAPAPAKKASAPPAKKAAPKAAPKAAFQASGSFAYGLIGADTEAGEFDPLGFSTQVDEETVNWYRAAELKHGRVCMTAALGLLFAPLFPLPDKVFEAQGGLAALSKISAERPEAIWQIITAIAAVETASLLKGDSTGAGDLGFDPLGFKSKYPDQEAMQLRELKNGRLAMLATSALLLQEQISGLGPWEQLAQK